MSSKTRPCKAEIIPRKSKGKTVHFWAITNHRGDALAISPKRYSTRGEAKKPLARFLERGGFKLNPTSDEKDCTTFTIG